jgi:hypothetical protein
LTLYVDGVADSAHGWIFPSLSGGKAPLWSQGDNIVYECGSTNPSAANQVGLCFDGKSAYLANKPVFGNLTLTPDVSHIFLTGGIAANGFRLFLDGVPLLEGFALNGHSGAPGFPPGTWEIEPNGALEILTQDNVGVKRITVTPGSPVRTLLVQAKSAAPGCGAATPLALFFVQLAAGVQVVEVHYGVEDQGIIAFGFASVDRIRREQDDMALAFRGIDDIGMLSDVLAVFDEA